MKTHYGNATKTLKNGLLDNQQVTQRIQKESERASLIKWVPPQYGLVKCNYDASHHQGSNKSGMGWVVRNTVGTILHCGMGTIPGTLYN